MADVLERVGWTVNFPEAQTCCGQPAFNSGYRDEARRVAGHFRNVFQDSEYVVVASGSCTSMITHHYAELFDGSHQHRNVYEFSDFLLNVAQVEDVGASYNGIATYHDSCHALRELQIKEGPRRLLRHVRGLELREMDAAEECCGFGGTFAVKFSGVSTAMSKTKIASILRTGADTLISIDSSCLMQMAGTMSRMGTPVRAMHLAEVLACR